MIASRSVATSPDDELFAGDTPVWTTPEVLNSGQNLVRGAVLGRITVNGKLTLSAAAAVDGSQVPVCVLAHPCNATAGDTNCVVYKAGFFAADRLTFGAGHTAATVANAWDRSPLALKTPLALP